MTTSIQSDGYELITEIDKLMALDHQLARPIGADVMLRPEAIAASAPRIQLAEPAVHAQAAAVLTLPSATRRSKRGGAIVQVAAANATAGGGGAWSQSEPAAIDTHSDAYLLECGMLGNVAALAALARGVVWPVLV